MTEACDYNVAVIGSSPGVQRAAIHAAKIGRKAAVVERSAVMGGVRLNTGPIPRKAFREAVKHLSGYVLRSVYGSSYSVKENITMRDLLFRYRHVICNAEDMTVLFASH